MQQKFKKVTVILIATQFYIIEISRFNSQIPFYLLHLYNFIILDNKFPFEYQDQDVQDTRTLYLAFLIKY